MISPWWWLALAVASAAAGGFALAARHLRSELAELQRVTARVGQVRAGVAAGDRQGAEQAAGAEPDRPLR